MAHGNPIIHRNGVELFGNAASRFNLFGDQFTEIAQMDVTRYKLGERVHNRDNRLTEIGVGHSGGAPQRTSTRHITTMSGGGGTVLRHTLFTPSVCLVNGTVRAVPFFVFID